MLTDIVCVIVTGVATLFPAPVASSALSLAWIHSLGVLQREWVQPREGSRWCQASARLGCRLLGVPPPAGNFRLLAGVIAAHQ